MKKYEKLGEVPVFESKLLHVYEDHLRLPDGREVVYDLLRHRGGAAVLPVTEEGKILLIRQYRNALDDFVFELPAGLKEEDDLTGERCARRELKEETGYTAEKLTFLARAYGCIGFSDEKTEIFLAEGLTPGETRLDDDENIEVHFLELEDALRMIEQKEIVDAKTIIAVYAYAYGRRSDHAAVD